MSHESDGSASTGVDSWRTTTTAVEEPARATIDALGKLRAAVHAYLLLYPVASVGFHDVDTDGNAIAVRLTFERVGVRAAERLEATAESHASLLATLDGRS